MPVSWRCRRVAGALATRVGPATTLAAGTALGTLGTTGMFLGAGNLAVAVCCSFLLSLTAGTLVTSGFNMAGLLAPAERQGIVSSLVMVMTAIGSVVLNFVGAAVLESTDVTVNGSTENSAGGVDTYITVATGAIMAAAVVAVLLVRQQRRRRSVHCPNRFDTLLTSIAVPPYASIESIHRRRRLVRSSR